MQFKQLKTNESKFSINTLKAITIKCYLNYRRVFFLGGFNFILLSSAIAANASAITTGMNSDIANEFKKQFSLQKQANKSTKLALMNNPYQKILRVINGKLSDEAENGQPRRLMTHDESIIKAKMNRFEACQVSVAIFIGFSKSAQALSTMKYPATKEQIMTDNFASVEYPFTVEDTNDGDSRPEQVALELGWMYRGNGEENVELFFETCLAIPIDLYYWEDSF
jgi:hypothetical protein